MVERFYHLMDCPCHWRVNPFTLYSKEPTCSYQGFITGEARYTGLAQAIPERTTELFAKAENTAKEADHTPRKMRLKQYKSALFSHFSLERWYLSALKSQKNHQISKCFRTRSVPKNKTNLKTHFPWCAVSLRKT